MTPKQLKFAEALGHGIDGEPCSISDAYRHAYDTEKMSDARFRARSDKGNVGIVIKSWGSEHGVVVMSNLFLGKEGGDPKI